MMKIDWELGDNVYNYCLDSNGIFIEWSITSENVGLFTRRENYSDVFLLITELNEK